MSTQTLSVNPPPQRGLISRSILQQAFAESFVKLLPQHQWRNPVMFVVYLGSILTTILWLDALGGHGEAPAGFILAVTIWLWFTVLFANFAEAVAEGRSKAQAAALRGAKRDIMAKKLDAPRKAANWSLVASATLRKGDVFLVEAGDFIPADGEVIEGVASVDESAITGESAPVIRESGGDFSSVTGGTRLRSDWLVVRVSVNQGEAFLDRMIAMVEGARRQKTPNEIALTILLVIMTLVFMLATVTLLPFSIYGVELAKAGSPVTITVLVALLVCLIPTTIGGLLSAIGLPGIGRMLRANVIATSGRAVEAAGDVDVLLLDKTGTITLGNRQATAFLHAAGVTEHDLADAAQLASLADETPEGRSIMVLAKQKFNLRERDIGVLGATFVPFSAHTRMSGADIGERRKGNLIALRELAMRAAADRVDAEMREYRDEQGIRGTWAAGECLMVCIGPDAQAEKLVRAGKRMATALHARWLVVYVETPDLLRMPEAERNRRIDLLRLAESLGAESVTLDGPSASRALLEYASTRNVNRVLLGRPNRRGWRGWLRPSTTSQLVSRARDTDVYVVSGEEAARARLGPVLARSSAYLGLGAGRSGKKRAPGYAWAIATSVFCTAICWVLKAWFDLPNLIMIYLLGAAVIAARFGRGAAILSAVLNVAAFDFFFVPPFFSLAVSDTQYLVTFAVMLAVTLLIGNLTASVRLLTQVAGHRERRTASLYAMSRELAAARGADNLASIAVRHTSEVFDSQVAVLLPDGDGRIAHPRGTSLPGSLRGADLSVAQWVFDHGRNAGLGTDTLPGNDAIYLPLKSGRPAPAETTASAAQPAPALGVLALLPANPRRVLLPEQLHLLETFAGQVALALERVHLADQAQQAEIHAENERMRNSLLSSISHDLRTPLAVIAGSASTLVEGRAALTESKRREMAQAIYERARQMAQQGNNILDMTRFEIGAPQLNRQWQPLEEIVGAVLHRMQSALQGRKVALGLPEDLPLILIDGVLIGQVLSNLLENAVKYTPPGSPIEIDAWTAGDDITLSLIDRGPGIKPGDEERVFDKFHRGSHEGAVGGAGLGLTICRAIVEAHGGRIWAENRVVGGAMFCFTLPLGGTPPMVEQEVDSA